MKLFYFTNMFLEPPSIWCTNAFYSKRTAIIVQQLQKDCSANCRRLAVKFQPSTIKTRMLISFYCLNFLAPAVNYDDVHTHTENGAGWSRKHFIAKCLG